MLLHLLLQLGNLLLQLQRLLLLLRFRFAAPCELLLLQFLHAKRLIVYCFEEGLQECRVAMGELNTVVLQLQPYRAKPAQASLRVCSRRGRKSLKALVPEEVQYPCACLLRWC